jgi:hypothetical protein
MSHKHKQISEWNLRRGKAPVLTLLVLNLLLDIINGVGWFDLQSNCFAGERLHEDLHLRSTDLMGLFRR